MRWAATHALALVAALVPGQIGPLLPDLAAKVERDRSVIVRDCAVIALGEYGRSLSAAHPLHRVARVE